ncbi:MAG: hypothetical protein Q7S01_01685 [bacterium]|nr:hypothetical protein [bacterium]
MKTTSLKIVTATVFLGFLIPVIAFAQGPGIPHKFFGTATYTNGSNITSGSVIVKIGTTQVASESISSGKYGYNPDLLFVTDPDNNRTGSILKFFIDSVDTGATAVFANGEHTELNFTTAVPSDTVFGNGADVSVTSAGAGSVSLPAGATNVVLNDTTVMNLSSGLSGRAVTLNSGVSGTPIVLTNSALSSVSASFPDGTKITGPSGWDGKVTPPVSGTPSGGSAPAGYSVGSTVVSVGSPDGTLTFDKPVTLVLTGVTGAVGYRPSGSDTWVRITNVCASPYATPGNPPANSECSISDGTNTKIVTYHFTSFGSLAANPAPAPAPAPSGGGGGGGGTTNTTPTVTPTVTALTAAQKVYDTNNDNHIDVLDFNSLMVHWGEKGATVVADFDGNGTVDVFDFNLLMVHWTA